MDPLIIISALATAIVTGIGILYRAIQKGDFIPGSIYRERGVLLAKAEARAEKAEKRADKAEDQAALNLAAIREVNATVKQALDQRGTGDANAAG